MKHRDSFRKALFDHGALNILFEEMIIPRTNDQVQVEAMAAITNMALNKQVCYPLRENEKEIKAD